MVGYKQCQYKFNKHVEKGEDGLISRKELYSTHGKYCDSNGFNPFGKNTFGKRLRDIGYESESKYYKSKTTGCYIGLKLE